MRLSDAMMMPTDVTLDPTVWRSSRNSDCGCLIGIGMESQGRSLLGAGGAFFQEKVILAENPWMKATITPPSLPDVLTSYEGDGTYYAVFHGEPSRIIDVISYMARAVFQRAMTLEQAADWVRSVEPAEPFESDQEQASEEVGTSKPLANSCAS